MAHFLTAVIDGVGVGVVAFEDGLPVGVAALSSPFFPSLKYTTLVITSIRHCVYCAGSERKGWKKVRKKRPRQCMTDVTSSPVYLLSSEMFLGHAVEIKC